jgi:hypothetical protein
MTTCFIKYIIDPSKIADFEHYGKLWIEVNEMVGYITAIYCPNGANNMDTLLFLFRRWQITKFIGTKFRTHQDVLKHLSMLQRYKMHHQLRTKFSKPVFEGVTDKAKLFY